MRARPMIAGLLAAPCLVVAQDLPQRKAGLWEISMQMPGMPAGSTTTQQCVDAKSDAEMQRKALAGDPRQQCKPAAVKRTALGYEAQVECSSAEGKTIVTSRMSGDFASRYNIETQMRFEPPRHGQSGMQMTATAQHKGACPAGMAPGEMRMGALNIKPAAKP